MKFKSPSSLVLGLLTMAVVLSACPVAAEQTTRANASEKARAA